MLRVLEKSWRKAVAGGKHAGGKHAGGKLLEAVQRFYGDIRTCVQVEMDVSGWFPGNIGLRQGCVLINIIVDPSLIVDCAMCYEDVSCASIIDFVYEIFKSLCLISSKI